MGIEMFERGFLKSNKVPMVLVGTRIDGRYLLIDKPGRLATDLGHGSKPQGAGSRKHKIL